MDWRSHFGNGRTAREFYSKPVSSATMKDPNPKMTELFTDGHEAIRVGRERAAAEGRVLILHRSAYDFGNHDLESTCFCRPILIWPDDSRTAEELLLEAETPLLVN